MAMEDGQREKISSEVNKKRDLSKDNVIDKIKKELSRLPGCSNERKECSETKFDVNHMLRSDQDSRNKVDKPKRHHVFRRVC